jgi:hypothetical protein
MVFRHKNKTPPRDTCILRTREVRFIHGSDWLFSAFKEEATRLGVVAGAKAEALERRAAVRTTNFMVYLSVIANAYNQINHNEVVAPHPCDVEKIATLTSSLAGARFIILVFCILFRVLEKTLDTMWIK